MQGNAYAAQRQTRLACVRYGNVVGSRGSVVPRVPRAARTRRPAHDHRRAHDPLLDHARRRPSTSCCTRSRTWRAARSSSRRSRRCGSSTSPRPSRRALPRDVIGIRPGEKLHELLITSDESPPRDRRRRRVRRAARAPVVGRDGPERWCGKACRRRLRLRERHQRRVAVDRRPPLCSTHAIASPIDIPYGRQSVDDDDIAAVVDVLRGDWLTQGPAVERVRGGAVRSVTGAAHAVAFANGTAALHGAACGRRARHGRHRRHLAALVRRQRQLRALRGRHAPRSSTSIPKTLNLDLGSVPDGLRRARRGALRRPAGRPRRHRWPGHAS